MALLLLCAAGIALGLRLELVALMCVSALAVVVSLLTGLGEGVGQIVGRAVGAWIAPQVGFGVGIAVLSFLEPHCAFGAHRLRRRLKL